MLEMLVCLMWRLFLSSPNVNCILHEICFSSKSPAARKSRSPKKVRSPRKSRSPRRSPKRVRSPQRKSRSPKRSRSPRRRKARSPTPRPTKVHVGRLTRNVNKEHIVEIFAIYGSLKNVEMLPDRFHPEFSKGHAYVEYEQPDDAEKAILHMDGGQLFGGATEQFLTGNPICVMSMLWLYCWMGLVCNSFCFVYERAIQLHTLHTYITGGKSIGSR